jgi:hypothetical protein
MAPLTPESYHQAWAGADRDAGRQGIPDAPACRWCRDEGRKHIFRRRHAGVYFCPTHDQLRDADADQ